MQKEPNPPFAVEIVDTVPTEVKNPYTKQAYNSQLRLRRESAMRRFPFLFPMV